MTQIDGGDAERYNEVDSSGHWRIVEAPREDPLWLRAREFCRGVLLGPCDDRLFGERPSAFVLNRMNTIKLQD